MRLLPCCRESVPETDDLYATKILRSILQRCGAPCLGRGPRSSSSSSSSPLCCSCCRKEELRLEKLELADQGPYCSKGQRLPLWKWSAPGAGEDPAACGWLNYCSSACQHAQSEAREQWAGRERHAGAHRGRWLGIRQGGGTANTSLSSCSNQFWYARSEISPMGSTRCC